LTLYAARAGAFTDESTAAGSMFAAYSLLTLLAAGQQDQAEHLVEALDSNRRSGLVVGIW
jgi:hypothetical protein